MLRARIGSPPLHMEVVSTRELFGGRTEAAVHGVGGKVTAEGGATGCGASHSVTISSRSSVAVCLVAVAKDRKRPRDIGDRRAVLRASPEALELHHTPGARKQPDTEHQPSSQGMRRTAPKRYRGVVLRMGPAPGIAGEWTPDFAVSLHANISARARGDRMPSGNSFAATRLVQTPTATSVRAARSRPARTLTGTKRFCLTLLSIASDFCLRSVDLCRFLMGNL
jgi:hypothetical protein